MRSKLSDLFLSLAIAGVLCLSPCHRMESKIAACEAHLKDCQDVCLSIPLCRVICTQADVVLQVLNQVRLAGAIVRRDNIAKG